LKKENAPATFKLGQANHDYQMNQGYRIHSPDKFLGGIALIIVGLLSFNYTDAISVGDITKEMSELLILTFAIFMIVIGIVYIYYSFFGDMKVYYKRRMGTCGITGDARCSNGDCRKCTFALMGAMEKENEF